MDNSKVPQRPAVEEPFVIIATIWIEPSMTAEYLEFEQRAAAAMAAYGGAIERVIRLADQPDAGPFEVHIVSFPSADAFARYRADAATAELARQRERVIRRTDVLTGFDIPPYG